MKGIPSSTKKEGNIFHPPLSVMMKNESFHSQNNLREFFMKDSFSEFSIGNSSSFKSSYALWVFAKKKDYMHSSFCTFLSFSRLILPSTPPSNPPLKFFMNPASDSWFCYMMKVVMISKLSWFQRIRALAKSISFFLLFSFHYTNQNLNEIT